MVHEKLESIAEMITEMKEDSSTQKNVKTKLSQVLEIFNEDADLDIIIDKTMTIFDELNEDSNIDSYTRTQLWNIVSLLESY